MVVQRYKEAAGKYPYLQELMLVKTAKTMSNQQSNGISSFAYDSKPTQNNVVSQREVVNNSEFKE